MTPRNRREKDQYDPNADDDPSDEVAYRVDEVASRVHEYLNPELEAAETEMPLEHLEEIAEFFKLFDLKGMEGVKPEDFEEIWRRVGKDPDRVIDFTLLTYYKKRHVKRVATDTLSLFELKEYMRALPLRDTQGEDYDIRKEFLETFSPGLIKLIDINIEDFEGRRVVYQILSGEKRRKNNRAARFVAWLINEPYMVSFAERLKEERNETVKTFSDLAILATMHMMEVEKWFAETQKFKFNMDISVEREAYESQHMRLLASKRLCEMLIAGFDPEDIIEDNEQGLQSEEA